MRETSNIHVRSRSWLAPREAVRGGQDGGARVGAVAIVAFAATLLVACQSGAAPPAATSVPLVEASQFIPAPTSPPDAQLIEPAWLADGQTLVAVLTYTPRGTGATSRLVSVDRSGAGLAPLPLLDLPECVGTDYVFPRVLADGRVAFLQQCKGNNGTSRSLPEEGGALLALDLQTGLVAPLRPYYVSAGSGHFDFAPDPQLGVLNDNVGLREQIKWLGQDGLEPVELGFARVFTPSWSPDGSTIAFAAVPDAFGRTGPSKIGLPAVLYLLDVASGTVRPLADGFTLGGRPGWSPDGRWLAVSLDIRSPDRQLWLIEVATGKRRLLWGREDVYSASWSPDGRSIATEAGLEWWGSDPATRGAVGLSILDVPDLEAAFAGPD